MHYELHPEITIVICIICWGHSFNSRISDPRALITSRTTMDLTLYIVSSSFFKSLIFVQTPIFLPFLMFLSLGVVTTAVFCSLSSIAVSGWFDITCLSFQIWRL